MIISRTKLDNVVKYSGLQGPEYESLKYLFNLGKVAVKITNPTLLWYISKHVQGPMEMLSYHIFTAILHYTLTELCIMIKSNIRYDRF